MAFGDTDHDGRNEAVFYWQGPSFDWHYVIFEEQGNNVYSQEYVGADLIPWAVGDLDQDGKAEIIGQFGYYVQVYESVDATSYPTQLVWSSPALSNIEGFTAIGDTDRDGRMEIIQSVNSGYLCIFENSGNDTYTLVFSTQTGYQDDGPKVISDFDGDGLLEIAFCGGNGRLHVYESPADNIWGETFSAATGLVNAYGADGGVDTDGNGLPEIFVAGDAFPGYEKTTLVYEESGESQFTRVATLPSGDFSAGGASNTQGDLKGTGRCEYVTQTQAGLLLYESTGMGKWTVYSQVSQLPTEWHIGVQTSDVNRNGRSELFWDSDDHPALVLEHPPRTSDTGPEPSRLQPLLLSPNPFRIVATVLVPNATSSADLLSVYDVAGRLVQRLRFPGSQGAHVWNARGLSAGVYYFQLESPSGAPLARGRGTLVR